MAVLTRTHLELQAHEDQLAFGPWTFDLSALFTQFVGTVITIAGHTTGQILGGVSPAILSVTTGQFLLVRPDKDVLVGLHGVVAQTNGFGLDAFAPLVIGSGSLTSLQIYNTTTSLTRVFIGIGGV